MGRWRARDRVVPGLAVAAAAAVIGAAAAAAGAEGTGSGAAAAGALAGGAPVTLKWSAPAACPNLAHMEGEIERLLGRPLETASPEPLRVRARVSRGKRGVWHMRLETYGHAGSGERALEGETCEGVARATALIIALAIDPELMVSRAAAPERAPAPGPDAAAAEAAATALAGDKAPAGAAGVEGAAVARTARAGGEGAEGPGAAGIGGSTAAHSTVGPEDVAIAEPGPRRRSSGPRLTLRAATAMDVATLPGLTPGLGVSLGVHVSPFKADVSLALWPSREAKDEYSGASARIGLESLAVRGCWTPRVEVVFELPVCVGGEVGRMHGRVNEDAAVPSPGDVKLEALFMAALAGAGVAWIPWDWLAIQLQAEAVIATERPRFVIENVGTIHRPPAVSGRSFFGVEVRFF